MHTFEAPEPQVLFEILNGIQQQYEQVERSH